MNNEYDPYANGCTPGGGSGIDDLITLIPMVLATLLSIWLTFMFCQGCLNADWIQEAEEVSRQDAFSRCNPKDRKGSLPEGTVCRSAHCSRDKGNYSPRGICEYNGDLEGMYCSPIQPVVIWCAVSEVCGKVVENSQGTQAICKFDLD